MQTKWNAIKYQQQQIQNIDFKKIYINKIVWIFLATNYVRYEMQIMWIVWKQRLGLAHKISDRLIS